MQSENRQCPAQLTKHAVKKICESDNLAQDMQGETVVLQISDLSIFEGEKVKKNIKGRAQLSDGVTKVICMLPEKIYKQVNEESGEMRKFDVWVLDASKQSIQKVNGKPVMVLKHKPEVFGKDVTTLIGQPCDYNTNLESGSFPDSFDLRVPGVQRQVENMEVEVVDEGAKFSSPNAEESKRHSIDQVMRSATPAAGKPSAYYMPVKALNQFSSDWTIKARVIKKAPVRSWKNATKSGELLNFDLVDKEGTMIQATAFNEEAKKFDDILEVDAVFTFSNGMVKLANKRFTSIPNDFCLTFSRQSTIERVAEDVEIQSVSFSFTGLDRIAEFPQSRTVDVIGVILEVGPSATINLRDGQQKEKRTLTIGDESNICLQVTLWGAVAEAHEYRSGQVISLKSCRVSDYNGKSLNASSHPEDIFLNIRHKRADELTSWVDSSSMNDIKGRMSSLAENAYGGEAGDKKASKTPTLLIKQLQELVEADEQVMGGKPFYANVNCDLTWIFVPDNTERQMFYLACEQCKKKVTKEGSAYYCEKCARTYENAVPTYNFSVRISDCSGTITLSCFGEIGQSILGINAKEFFAMHENIQAVKDLAFEKLNQTPMMMVIRAQVNPDNYGENGPSVRYTAVRTAEHSFKNANDNLMQLLTAYKSQSMEEEGVAF